MRLFYSRPLSIQLIVIFLLVFIILITSFGIFHYHSQINSIKGQQTYRILSLAKIISTTLSEDIYNSNYANIETKLLSLNLATDLNSITVYDNNERILSETTRDNSNSLVPTYRHATPNESPSEKSIKYNANDILTVQHPVYFSGQNIAWIKLVSNNRIIKEGKSSIFTRLLTFSLTMLAITTIIIYLFLQNRLKPLHALSVFSKRLHTSHGKTIEIKPTSPEIKTLVTSLNWASKEIDAQYREALLHKQTLEARVKDRTKKLRSAKESAEKANKAKTEFLARMSHELRTPLNAILGFSQILEMDNKDLTTSQSESVQEITDAGQHLLSMVNELLELSRIESGRYNIDMQHHEVGLIINEVISLLTPLTVEQNISIKLNTDDAITSMLSCDRLRTKQVLLNVISNAIKYNKQNGQIEIAILQQPEKTTIRVRDTGKGIIESEVEHIFQPFIRSECSQEIEGTGIGLAISNVLMKAMGGNIQAESTLGVGSTFNLNFNSHA